MVSLSLFLIDSPFSLFRRGNLLAVRTRRLSIFQHPPIGSRRTRNLFLFPAMAFALAVAVFFSYVKFFMRTFGTRHVAVAHWFIPLAFGLGILLMDEGRKFIVRRHPKSLLAWLAW
jgi:sodium/potassium-transporting ATPase subunit alpha